MKHKYTYEEIKQEFENRDYILITDHKVKSNEKYEYICKKHQDKGSQLIDWGHFHCNGRGCYYCGRERTESARRKDLSKYNGKELAESKGFEYVGMSRHDNKIWVQFICPKHRQYGIQEMPYNNMKRVVVGCQHCIGRNDDEEIVLQEMYEANPYIELLESYQGRTKRIKMRCTLHDVISTKTPREVIEGKGCVQCGIEKLSISSKLPKEEYVERLKTACPDIELVSGYDSLKEYANFYCHKCDSQVKDRASYILSRGCPVCGGSSMEMKIGKILTEYHINYIPQFSFDDCKDQRKLPFDFYLPDYNTLIEYDGEQHYRPVNFGGITDEKAKENFLITRRHDKIKTKYCEQHKINLIRIPYWEKDNIELIILNNIKRK